MAHPDNPDYDSAQLFVPHVDLTQAHTLAEQIRISRNIIYSKEAKSRFAGMVDSFKPDIVHLHNFAHQISPSILDIVDKLNLPAVMTMHDYKLVCPAYTLLSKNRPCERCRKGRFHWCLLRQCIKDSYPKSLLNTIEMILHHRVWKIYDPIRIFIAPSRFLEDQCRRMGFKGKIIHLANFIRPRDCTADQTTQDGGICYFGRLSREKGLHTLLKAAEITRASIKIIGDGPIREELEAIKKNNRLDQVRFLGYLTGEDLNREIAASLAVVLPSEWYENNPLSILEAFSLGKPVIGARIGGIPELVEDGITGFTFEPGSHEQLAERIDHLLVHAHEATAMGAKAKTVVHDHHNPETHYDALMNIYKQAMHDGAAD
jgi:glycosyltransferase involved in cell wall biosynthesis